MTNLTAANNARLNQILDRKWIFEHGVDTFRGCVEKGLFARSEIGEVPSAKWDRRKFNRMGAIEQREYQRKLDTMKTEYRLFWAGSAHDAYSSVPKMLFDWFNKNGIDASAQNALHHHQGQSRPDQIGV